MLKKVLGWALGLAAVVTAVVAAGGVSTTSLFTFYEPEVPAELRK